MKTFISPKRNSLGAKQKGVTLIELVISIVILSIAVVAVMSSFGYSISHSADPLWRNKTLKLAQLYFDEILAKNFDDQTPVGGAPVVVNPNCAVTYLGPDTHGGSLETREDYNDVDDYNGLSESPPLSLLGSLDSSYDSYSVSVSVICDGNTVSASGINQAKKIMLSITPPGEDAFTFAAYKGNF